MAVGLLLLGLLLLRVRIRLQVEKDRRVLFFGLGRSGSELDFLSDEIRIKLAGLTIKVMSSEAVKPASTPAGAPKTRAPRAFRLRTKLWRKSKREFTRLRDGVLAASGGTVTELAKATRTVIKAVFLFIVDIVRDSRLEEFQARVEGGFDSPDLTGQAYGYYCALAGALPTSAGRVQFVPDWTGASLSGSARVSIAIPLYLLIYRTVRFLLRLPIKTIIRMARLKNEGGSDVQ